MRALGVVGWSGAGKTTLIAATLPLLIARGLRVATVKHAHHGFDIDRPGKDSHRHREAGAREVLLVGGVRWALLHEGTPPPLSVLLGRLQPVDLVLVEGFKAEKLPKIEVFRPAVGKPALWPDHPDIVAVATDPPHDGALAGSGRTVLTLSQPHRVAGWIAQWLETWRDPAERSGAIAGPAP